MKKIKIFSLILLCVSAFTVTSCDDEDTKGIAEGVVYYPVFKIDGNELNYVALGADFTVPEVIVMDGPNDITSEAIVEGDIDLTTPGYYEKTYTATTGDGYKDSKTIKVFVYHPDFKEAEISGDYKGSLSTIGGGPVSIKQVEKGVYILDDFFAGYYNTYRGFGAVYKAEGYLIYVGDNNFIGANINSPWGICTIEGGLSFDPSTGIIDYGLDNFGYNWGGNRFILTPDVEE